MPARVAEDVIRTRWFGRKVRVRVDLHGVSVFGPGDERVLIRWEWVQGISVRDGVVVTSDRAEIAIPAGAFGLTPDALGAALRRAQALDARPDVIAALSGDDARP